MKQFGGKGDSAIVEKSKARPAMLRLANTISEINCVFRRVESVLRQAHEANDQQFLAMAKGVDLDTLIGGVADHLKIEPQIIKSDSNQRRISRAIVYCLAVDQLRLSAADVVRKLSLSPSAVSKVLVRGRQDGFDKTMAKEIFSLK
jgi:hypothetical protein